MRFSIEASLLIHAGFLPGFPVLFDAPLQASGNQVKQNADMIGATFVTEIGQSDAGLVDYECSILATNRVYDNDGEDLFKQGFFILEVAVQQTVYVTAEVEMDLGNVTAIVETGFNRGGGGRVKFRSLLTANPAFATIVNVEVLDASLSAPQAAPSGTPSFAPSGTPSASPSLIPSASPSISPSQAPSMPASSGPSPMPSSRPSGSPADPNSAPSNQSPPGGDDDDSGFNRQPLIIGAIAGAVATIIVSCFFIFCVWYPFCWRKDNTRLEEATGHRRRRPSISSHSSESTKAAEAMIPGVLTLDDDARSLANTTVTLGTKPPSIYSKANMSAWRKRNASVEPVSMLDSFDESSVYTSIFTSTAPDLGQMQSSNTVVLQSTEAVHDIVMEASNETDSATDPFDLETRHEEDDGKEAASDSDSDPFLLEEQQEEKVEESGSTSDSDSDPFVMEQYDEKDEEKSAELSTANVGVSTKGFDPYTDDGDSSIGFSSSIAISDSSFGPPMNDSVGKISLSSTSTKTKRIDNLVPAAPEDDSSDIWEDERREMNRESDEDVLSSSSVVADSAVTQPSSSIASAANNSLLRSILEDARLLAKKQSSSSRSRGSGMSAPSRLLEKRGTNETKAKMTPNGRQTPPLLTDILADNIQLKDDEDPSRSPSRSVGAPPRSTLGSPEKPTKFEHRRKYLDTDSMLSESDKLVDKFEKKGRPPLSSPSGKVGATRGDSALVAPSSTDLSSTRGRETLGARPMANRWEKSTEDDDLITPSSSPGMLGSLSSPWLFDTEAPLGARPRNSSSNRSGWSTGSQSSGESESGIDITHRERLSNPVGQSSSEAADAMNGGTLGEYKAASEEMSPSPIENDFLRWERHHVNDRRAGDQTTASDYSGSSTGGASRSTTRSSLITLDHTNTKRVIVVAPPGKLGVTLADHHDGKGIVVSAVRPYSSMKGKLSPGDKLVAVDDEDVSNMVVSKITSMMASRASQERRLTLITSTSTTGLPVSQETKQDGSP